MHRWLSGTVPPATRLQRALEITAAAALIATAFAVAAMVVGIGPAIVPVATALAFSGAAIAILVLARRADPLMPTAAVALLALFMAGDLRWNNAPHESTALPRDRFDALRQNTTDQTVHILKERLAAAAAPDRRDRVELIGVGYHWPNLGLAQGFDHVFGHNPLRLRWFYEATRVGDTVALASQRQFSPLYPSYRSAFADLFGVRFIATGVPIEQIDTSLKPGDLHTRRPHRRGLHLRKPARVAARHAVHRLAVRRFRRPDPQRLAGCRSGPHRAAQARARGHRAGVGRRPRNRAPGALHQHRGRSSRSTAPLDEILVLNDVWHPWWRATVDGVATEILKANVIFRAVLVPRGHHTVRFTFHPFSGALTELIGKMRGAAR